MTMNELVSMTVAELKALAKRRNVALPSGAKKAEIVRILARTSAVPVPKSPARTKSLTRRNAPLKRAGGDAAERTAPVRKAVRKRDASFERTEESGGGPAPAEGGIPKYVPEWRVPPGSAEPSLSQGRVSESKYYTGGGPAEASRAYAELPRDYGRERIALLPRDPHMVFGYWEVSRERLDREKALFGRDSRLCVRIYDVTGVRFDGVNATAYYDQEVSELAGSWYFDLGRPARSLCAELGLLAPNGRFHSLTRSAVVTMPPEGVSDVIEEEWMVPDEEFARLYGVAGAAGGMSSLQARRFLRRRRGMAVSPPGLFSKTAARKR